MRIFAAVFAGMGLVVIAVGIAVSEEAGVGKTLAIFAFGVVFTAIAIGVWRSGTAPVVFDRTQGAFWRGRTPPAGAGAGAAHADYTPLADTRALQIIEERLSDKGGSFRSYELNLVLRDARRVNVLDHGDYPALRRDAECSEPSSAAPSGTPSRIQRPDGTCPSRYPVDPLAVDSPRQSCTSASSTSSRSGSAPPARTWWDR